MIWRLPDTYHSAGHGRGTATLKFYEGRDILGRSQRLPESRKVLDLIGELGPVSFQSVHSGLV